MFNEKKRAFPRGYQELRDNAELHFVFVVAVAAAELAEVEVNHSGPQLEEVQLRTGTLPGGCTRRFAAEGQDVNTRSLQFSACSTADKAGTLGHDLPEKKRENSSDD